MKSDKVHPVVARPRREPRADSKNLALAMALATLVGSAAGCGDTEAPSRQARYALAIDEAGDVIATRDGVTLVRIPRDGLALGVVDDDATYNYDPWWLDDTSVLSELAPKPRGLRWLAPSSWTIDDDALRLDYPEGRTARLTLAADRPDGASHRIVIACEAGADAVAYMRVALAIAPDERLYGLGNQLDHPELRGRRVALQLEADPTSETLYNERHVTTPLLVAAGPTTAGWAALLESDWPGLVDVAATDPDRVVVTYGPGVGAHPKALPLRVFLADHPLDVYRLYYAVTGPPRLPARWAHGPWFWRDETPGQGALEARPDAHNPGVLHDLATIRALDLPMSGYWIDRPYATALQTFDFDPDRYDDPAAMIATAHRLGFRVALWHAPYVVPEAGEVYDDAVAAGILPPASGITLNTFGGTAVDFTSPGAVAWWRAGLAAYTAQRIEGYKLDFGEDVVPGLPGLRTNVWRFADGTDERTMHARYAEAYHRPYLAEMPADGGFILARAAARGGHTHVDVLWPGDLDADFARHGDRPEGGALGRVGGIPAALSYHLSVTASGMPWFAADTGGYRHGPPSAEALSRWFEMTALAPVMQIGGDDNHAPWELATFGYDQALLDRFRELARLHLRLAPFFWGEAARLLVDGRPIVRALGLAHPELGQHPADQYLLGDALLVAPVVVEGARERDVIVPPGRWIDWWDGAAREAPADGARATVAAPLGRPPLWLAEGAIVPMLRPGVDTLAPADDPAVDSAADARGRLWVRIARGRDASAALYDGARVRLAGDTITWRGATAGEGVVLELVGEPDADPSAVTLDGRALATLPASDPGALEDGEGWRREGRSLWVALAGSGTVRVR